MLRLALILVVAVAGLALLEAHHRGQQPEQVEQAQAHFQHGLLQQVQVLPGLMQAVAVAVVILLVVQVVLAVAVTALGRTIRALLVGKAPRNLAQPIQAVAVAVVGTTAVVHPVMVAPASSLFATQFKENLNGTFCKSS
jgi:hypothetical protein